MRKLIQKTVFFIGGMLAFGAFPAYCNNFINFNLCSACTGTGVDRYTTTGGSFDISQLVYNSTTTFNIPTADALVVNYTLGAAGTASLTILNGATSDFAGVAANAVLYSATTNISITGTSTTGAGGSLNVTILDAVAQAFSNTTFFTDLASDLSLPAGTADSFLISGGIIGSTVGPTSAVTSDTMGFTPTPEPSSILLFGAGLTALGFLAKKRGAKAV